MQIEIERKYLLKGRPEFPKPAATLEIDQGYIPGEKLIERLRRQRDTNGVTRYFRTVKVGSGISRAELEDETDARTFDHLWKLTDGRRLKKRRYVVLNGDDMWEIDPAQHMVSGTTMVFSVILGKPITLRMASICSSGSAANIALPTPDACSGTRLPSLTRVRIISWH